MARAIEQLSARFVKECSEPGKHADGDGLYLQVTRSGNGTIHRSWTFRYRWQGRQRELGMGTPATWTLAEARTRAKKYRQLVADGIDPIEDRRARRTPVNKPTFAEVSAEYIEAHRSGWKNAKHAAQWESTLATYCGPIASMPIDEITTDHVLQCLEPEWAKKTETMTRVRQRVEAVMDYATAKKKRKGENPARWRGHLDKLLPKRSKVQKVKPRPALPYTRAAEFIADLRKRPGFSARCLELQVLTAVRPGESAGARWAEFDLDAATWTIPAERMKAEKEHRVPLSAQAVKMLRELPCMHANRVHVFPGIKKGKPLTTAAPEKLLKTMHAESIEAGDSGYMDPKEGKPAVPHGFRSTFRTWAADDTNYPRDLCEAALAHTLKGVEGDYNRGEMLRRRAALMDAWANYCDGKKEKTKRHG